MKNDENIFILSNQANYSTKVTSVYSDVVLSYCNLINFYVSYSIENMNIKDKEIFFTGLIFVFTYHGFCRRAFFVPMM